MSYELSNQIGSIVLPTPKYFIVSIFYFCQSGLSFNIKRVINLRNPEKGELIHLLGIKIVILNSYATANMNANTFMVPLKKMYTDVIDRNYIDLILVVNKKRLV